MEGLLGPGIASLFGQWIRRMEVAEEEITAAKERHPSHREHLQEAFRHLSPTQPLRDLSEDLYRYHCREILDRVVHGKDVRPGTTAEIVAMLSQVSLETMPSRPATLLYSRLFAKLFPEQAAKLQHEVGPVATDLDIEREARELEATMREKLTAPRGTE